MFVKGTFPPSTFYQWLIEAMNLESVALEGYSQRAGEFSELLDHTGLTKPSSFRGLFRLSLINDTPPCSVDSLGTS